MDQSIHDELYIISGAMTAIKISINLGWVTLQNKLTDYRIAYQFGKGENTCVNWYLFVCWSCRRQSQYIFTHFLWIMAAATDGKYNYSSHLYMVKFIDISDCVTIEYIVLASTLLIYPSTFRQKCHNSIFSYFIMTVFLLSNYSWILYTLSSHRVVFFVLFCFFPSFY